MLSSRVNLGFTGGTAPRRSTGSAALPGRRAFLALLALGGCGFSPALGTGGPAQKLVGTVRAQSPKDQLDFDFVSRIEDRLGRPQTTVYDLKYAISTKTAAVGITADGAITRYNLAGSVDWSLIRQGDGARMAGGTVDSFASYSATGSTVAGLAAKEDAEARLMVILADEIIARLMATADAFPA